jgi:hypothetical protein
MFSFCLVSDRPSATLGATVVGRVMEALVVLPSPGAMAAGRELGALAAGRAPGDLTAGRTSAATLSGLVSNVNIRDVRGRRGDSWVFRRRGPSVKGETEGRVWC